VKFAPYNATNRRRKNGRNNLSYHKQIACLSEAKEAWTKALNMVFSNGKEPKYDMHAWSSDQAVMKKGITLSPKEVAA